MRLVRARAPSLALRLCDAGADSLSLLPSPSLAQTCGKRSQRTSTGARSGPTAATTCASQKTAGSDPSLPPFFPSVAWMRSAPRLPALDGLASDAPEAALDRKGGRVREAEGFV